jgi:hypothetical protein
MTEQQQAEVCKPLPGTGRTNAEWAELWNPFRTFFRNVLAKLARTPVSQALGVSVGPFSAFTKISAKTGS